MNFYKHINGDYHISVEEMMEYFKSWESSIEDFENDEDGNEEIKKEYEFCRNQAIEMGKILNEIGGFELMQNIHSMFVPLGLKRIIELYWSGIGEWQG